MVTETPSNKPTLVSRYALLATALQSMQESELTLGGKLFPKATLVAALNAYVSANQATGAQRQKWQKAVAEEQAALAAAKPLRALTKTYLQSKLGKSSAEMGTYGFDPAKAPKTTVTAKATAKAKAQATRTARGTMGSAQKKDVKGDVVGITVTPVTATPVAAPKPVATGPAAGAPIQGTGGAAPPHAS